MIDYGKLFGSIDSSRRFFSGWLGMVFEAGVWESMDEFDGIEEGAEA